MEVKWCVYSLQLSASCGFDLMNAGVDAQCNLYTMNK